MPPPDLQRAAARLPTRLGAIVWVALVGLPIGVAHLPSFVHPLLDGDEGVYGAIAVLMNLGGGLYDAGGVDNKPPGIFWVYAVVFRLFGAYQMTAIHVVAFAVLAATCVSLFVIARDIAGLRAGVLAALFYGVLTAAGNPRLLAANTELFMMLPLTVSVLLMLRRRWFWAGAVLIVAGTFRQSAAANVPLVALGVFWLEAGSRRWRAAMYAGAGLLAGLVAGAMLIGLTGSLGGFWRWTVATLVGYASTSWTPEFFWPRTKDSLVPFLVDMAVLWIAAVVLATRWKSLAVRVRLMTVWLVLGMTGSLAGGHLSWHYFIQAMGPLAVVAGIAFDRFHLRRLVAAAAIAGVALPAAAWWAFDIKADPLTYDYAKPPRHDVLASYVDAHASATDRIFIWGNWAALYPESNRVMATRFPGFLRGFPRGSDLPPDNWDTAPDVWPLVQADLEAHPPALILDMAPAYWSDFTKYPMSDYPVLAGFVATHYHQVATVEGVVVYARL